MTSTRATDDRLMTAGRFGRATLLSAKALRLYAERDLLPPAYVDPVNGYRYYAPDQIRTGWLIALLRSAELSLEDVGRIVAATAVERPVLLERVVDAARQRAEVSLAVLARVRHHLREESDMSELVTRTESDRPVLSVLRRMRPEEMDEVIPREVGRLRELAEASGVAVTGDSFGVFHAPVTDESDGPLEIVLPVDDLAALPTDGDVRAYRLAGGPVAERTAEGPETDFPDILARYDEVHAWITASGRTPVGPPREIWHNSPHDPEPLRLTISWPYAVG